VSESRRWSCIPSCILRSAITSYMANKVLDAYSPTSTRWNPEAFYHPNSSRLNTLPPKGGHFLKQDPYVFDAAFFNKTAAEAMALDPKQRIAMELAYEAFENASTPLQQVSGTQTACYIGSGMSDYRQSIERAFMHSPKYHLLAKPRTLSNSTPPSHISSSVAWVV